MSNNDMREALQAARDALEEIAMAGMSGTGQETEEGMRAWHARRAWEFIGIAARALDPIRAALAAPAPVALTNTDRALWAFRAMRSKDAIAHRERMANAPKGACESCYGDGEIGGQFCGGFEPCAECSGTGRANGGKATGQEGG